MLMLDPATLFYWNLSNALKKPRHDSDHVSKWVTSLSHKADTNLRPSSKHSTSTSHSAAPSLTNQSTIMATSVHTSNPLPPQIHIKPKLEEDTFLNIFSNDDGQLFVIDGGVISNKDEMVGEEHEEAVKCPLKGSGVCVGSEVSLSSLLSECCKLTI